MSATTHDHIAARELPGRRVVGRRVLFYLPDVKAWAAAGCPATPPAKKSKGKKEWD